MDNMIHHAHPAQLQGYRDGFAAAVNIVSSIKIRSTFGPEATPEFAEYSAVEAIKRLMEDQGKVIAEDISDHP